MAKKKAEQEKSAIGTRGVLEETGELVEILGENSDAGLYDTRNVKTNKLSSVKKSQVDFAV